MGLLEAAQSGEWAAVRMLVEDGADIDSRNERGETALTLAAARGDADTVAWLLQRRANPNVNVVPFSRIAAFRQRLELFMIFRISCNCPTARLIHIVWNRIRYGGRRELPACAAPARTGRTPLMAAAAGGNIACIDLLLNRGARIDGHAASGDTVLIWASRNGKEEMVQKLIQRGADVNRRNRSGNAALIWAARNGHAGIVQNLLQHGAEVDGRDLEANTPLIAAAEAGHTGVVRNLLASGAKIDVRNSARASALMAAVSAG